MLSLAAHANQVPVISVFPFTTFDPEIASGDQVEIEERAASEVNSITVEGTAAYPTNARVKNPAFDVTPNELITAWVTDRGIITPPFVEKIQQTIYNT
jgi:methylthioribose-1-phosphate isomerase